MTANGQGAASNDAVRDRSDGAVNESGGQKQEHQGVEPCGGGGRTEWHEDAMQVPLLR